MTKPVVTAKPTKPKTEPLSDDQRDTNGSYYLFIGENFESIFSVGQILIQLQYVSQFSQIPNTYRHSAKHIRQGFKLAQILICSKVFEILESLLRAIYLVWWQFFWSNWHKTWFLYTLCFTFSHPLNFRPPKVNLPFQECQIIMPFWASTANAPRPISKRHIERRLEIVIRTKIQMIQMRRKSSWK